VASRKEQKEAARRAREQAHAQLKASQQARTRMIALAGVLVVVIVAAVVVIVASSSGGGSLKALNPSKLSSAKIDGAYYSPKQAVSVTDALLAGIPEEGATLGSPTAPVTVTEYLDFACPTCDDYELTTGSQLIAGDVRDGKVKVVYRAAETASSYANANAWAANQAAAVSAGLQGRAWYYLELIYDQQPQEINGQDAEDVAYINSAYMQNRAAEIPGLNLAKWQADLSDPTVTAQVSADLKASQTQAPHGTPTIIVSGPKGSVTWDANLKESAVPTLAQLSGLISQVS
jgi:protein-disulfide isomerase